MATNCDMPEDVIFNILLWLPVVSLLRFKSVCKSWCSLIGSSGFISQHLHLATKDNDKIIRFDPEQSANHSCTSFSFSLLSGDKFEMCDEIFDLPVPYDRYGGLANIIATCNGIICLYVPDDIIILWNPAIRQYKLLPQSLQSLWNPAISQYKLLPENEYYADIHYGFGFDAENNHYKVVRLFIRDSIDLPKCRAEVYNLSNDTWRSIDAAFYCNCLYSNSDPKVPYRNGIYCWLGMLRKDNKLCDSILTFDFTSEVLGALSLPDEFSCQRCLLDLSILKGNIACIRWIPRSSEVHDWHFKIWVLTEYGVKESWTMLYTIRLTYQAWACSRKFSTSGKLFMLLEDKKCLCKPAECVCSNQLKMALCDCPTHKVSFLPIQLCKCLPHNLQVVVFNESLVSIKNANGEANRASCEIPTLKIPGVNCSKETVVKAQKKKDMTAEVAVQEVQYPVTEKFLQQRLVEEADYKFTTELSAKTYNMKSLDNFVPRSEGNFLEYAELISHKLVLFENSTHYIGLLKNIMKLSMRNLKAADAKELALLVTTIANEKGGEAIAGKSKSAVWL